MFLSPPQLAPRYIVFPPATIDATPEVVFIDIIEHRNYILEREYIYMSGYGDWI